MGQNFFAPATAGSGLARSLRAAGLLPVLALACAGVGQAELREDLIYQQTGDLNLKMDAYLPAGKGPFPAAILIHGGGWVGGDRRTHVQPFFAPLAQAGFAWFSISYRLAPQFFYPAPVEDVEQAVRYVRQHAREFNIDPDRIVLVGESAGAHLAALAAMRALPGAEVAAVVAYYPPMDLVTLARTAEFIPREWRQMLESGIGAGWLMPILKEISPLTHIRKGMPPFLLVHGASDHVVPVKQSQIFCESVNAAGSACELITVPGAGHGVRYWHSAAAKQVLDTDMTAWLRERLKLPVTPAPE